MKNVFVVPDFLGRIVFANTILAVCILFCGCMSKQNLRQTSNHTEGGGMSKYWALAYMDSLSSSPGPIELSTVTPMTNSDISATYEIAKFNGVRVYGMPNKEDVLVIQDKSGTWSVKHPCLRSGYISNIAIKGSRIAWHQEVETDEIRIDFSYSIPDHALRYVRATDTWGASTDDYEKLGPSLRCSGGARASP